MSSGYTIFKWMLAVTLLCAPFTLLADSLTVNFDNTLDQFGHVTATNSIGTLQLNLNEDGTISATLMLQQLIAGFAFNSSIADPSYVYATDFPYHAVSSNFSTTLGDPQDTNWGNGFGDYNSGFKVSFAASQGVVNSYSFLISDPGGFSSVYQIANLGSLDYTNGSSATEFWAYTQSGGQFGGSVVNAPEPGFLMLLGSGLGVFGIVYRKKIA